MPINPAGWSRAICSVTAFPQSPPCATYRLYPRRSIRAAHARAIRHCRELHALRLIVDDFPLGPLRRVDAPAQVGQIGVRGFETKWTNVGPITTPRLRDVTQCLRHGVNSPGKTE